MITAASLHKSKVDQNCTGGSAGGLAACGGREGGRLGIRGHLTGTGTMILSLGVMIASRFTEVSMRRCHIVVLLCPVNILSGPTVACNVDDCPRFPEDVKWNKISEGAWHQPPTAVRIGAGSSSVPLSWRAA